MLSRDGSGKQRNEAEHFQIRARPAVSDDDRQRMLSLAAFVNEVNSNLVVHESVVMERRDILKLSFPVEIIAPVVTDVCEELEIESILPSGAGNLINPARACEALAKVLYCCLGEVRAEGGYRHR